MNTGCRNNWKQLSASPYDKGWIAKIRIADESSLARLLDHAAYQKQCAGRKADAVIRTKP